MLCHIVKLPAMPGLVRVKNRCGAAAGLADCGKLGA